MYYLSASYSINGWIFDITDSAVVGGVPGPVHWSGINTYDSNWSNYFVNSKYPFQASNTPAFSDGTWHDTWPMDFQIGALKLVDAPPSSKGEIQERNTIPRYRHREPINP